MTCRHVADGQPRTLPGRHHVDCPDPDRCPGCLPCPHRHCVVCSTAHADGACAECVGTVRDDLTLIGVLCGDLPTEAVHRGVDSEASMLHGPAADPQAWRYRATSALFGRVPAGYLEDCRDEAHPLWVLGTWEQLWRDHLDHDTDARLTVPDALDYLGRQLTYMAAQPEPPFEDFAAEVRRCRVHLQAVVRDQNQGDLANVGCFRCGRAIERRLGVHGFDDHWTCRGCQRTYTAAEYNFALRAKLEQATP